MVYHHEMSITDPMMPRGHSQVEKHAPAFEPERHRRRSGVDHADVRGRSRARRRGSSGEAGGERDPHLRAGGRACGDDLGRGLCVRGGGRLAGGPGHDVDRGARTRGSGRALVRTVQEARKQAGLEVSDRITLRIDGSAGVVEALDACRGYVMEETLATGWGGRSGRPRTRSSTPSAPNGGRSGRTGGRAVNDVTTPRGESGADGADSGQEGCSQNTRVLRSH